MMCEGCTKNCGWLWLVAGVLFLLSDLTSWNFWGIQWYTVAFLLLGLGWVGQSSCKMCKKSKK